jgi:hypothetical protein
MNRTDIGLFYLPRNIFYATTGILDGVLKLKRRRVGQSRLQNKGATAITEQSLTHLGAHSVMHENYWDLTDFRDLKKSVKSVESVAFFFSKQNRERSLHLLLSGYSATWSLWHLFGINICLRSANSISGQFLSQSHAAQGKQVRQFALTVSARADHLA